MSAYSKAAKHRARAKMCLVAIPIVRLAAHRAIAFVEDFATVDAARNPHRANWIAGRDKPPGRVLDVPGLSRVLRQRVIAFGRRRPRSRTYAANFAIGFGWPWICV
jgi:hypothetical protein